MRCWRTRRARTQAVEAVRFRLPSTNRGSNVKHTKSNDGLIKADEILRAPADEMFVLAQGLPSADPMSTAPYWRYPAVASLMKSNRFAAQ